MIERICEKHQTVFKHYAGGQSKCTKCNSEHRLKNRRKFIQEAVEYKGGNCKKCGYNKCQAALEFHHRDPSQKEFQICNKNSMSKKVKKELDKCDMLCANCHRELHAEEQ